MSCSSLPQGRGWRRRLAAGTDQDDHLAGLAGADALLAGGGDDVLLDGAGSDVLSGGAGADIFLFTADGERDRILDFEPGVDQLDLTALSRLWDWQCVVVTSTDWGAELQLGEGIIEVYSMGGTALQLSDFGYGSFVHTDRVPVRLRSRTRPCRRWIRAIMCSRLWRQSPPFRNSISPIAQP